MNNLAKTKVGEIVASNYRTATVLTAHHIDFCCNGGITLEEACLGRSIPLEQVVAEIEESLKTPATENYSALAPDELISIIVNVHHKYIEGTLPALQVYLEKLSATHGERHPELLQIRDLINDAAEEFMSHMNKEELVLFPYIMAMVEAQKGGFPLSRPHFGDIENPIRMMETEHEYEGRRFEEIAELSGHYTCPPDGCQTYRVAYALLEEFEADLHKHIHLENNILFPAARQMFNEFKS